MKALLIHWIDSSSDHGWGKIKEIPQSPNDCITLGFLVRETEDFLLITHSWDPETSSVNGTIEIPKVAIKSRKNVPWKVPKTVKQKLV